MASVREIPQNPKIEYSLIYCIGGVCFNEYANLAEFDPNVIYTGDKFINYREFIWLRIFLFSLYKDTFISFYLKKLKQDTFYYVKINKSFISKEQTSLEFCSKALGFHLNQVNWPF